MDSAVCAEKPDSANRLYPGQDISAVAGPSDHARHDTNRGATPKRRCCCQLAGRTCRRVFRVRARPAAMIRIDAIWLATEPMDMRAGTETALA